MKDALGREIVVGDAVVYPVGVGAHGITLRAGVVLELREAAIVVRPTAGILVGRHHWRDRLGPRKDVVLHRVENVVRVPRA